jgi:carboxyl-terminal processing protease
MLLYKRVGVVAGVSVFFGLGTWFALSFGSGGLWKGLEPALAVTSKTAAKAPYDLTRLEAVNETLKLIREKYVEPGRVHPKEMLLASLNRIQQDVPQVIVMHEPNSKEVTVRVETAEKKFRVDNIQGPWDISARLGEIFGFLQTNLRGTDINLRDIEYAACNGMLHTLDPHSVFLSPEAYEEMSMSTSGHFGGLGIVISLRDEVLTVIKPMPDTPAGRAGIKRYDRITKINNESTTNMPLDDAVRRLRGKPNTEVTIWIQREGAWKGSRPFKLNRERISVRSVRSKLLDGNIGYIHLKQFQSTSAAEVKAALDSFRKNEHPLKGVVLDLRGNPGGLLEQAVKVTNLFVDRGVIVATVGASEGREEKRASARGTEPPYPLVVLVNGSSASASEIVAGALKNLDRAVIMGTSTFGKGSVQLVFSDITSEKAALKLTIAQYLTPGDISIQSVGIAPDIELDPMTVDKLEMDLFSNSKGLRERDLSAHLSNTNVRKGQKPTYTVRYYLPESERAKLRELGGEIDDTEFLSDFSIRFARELAAKMPTGQKRTEQLRSIHDYAMRLQQDEIGKAALDLKKIDIDWSDAPNKNKGPAADDFEVKIATDRENNEVTAGEKMTLKVTVKNNGKEPVYRLRGTTNSDNGYYEGKELIFGKIEPGKTRTAEVPLGWCDIKGRKPGSTVPTPRNAPRECLIPKDAITRQDGIKIHFESEGNFVPKDREIRPTIRGLAKPSFSYAFQVVDNMGKANGDGRIQRGEGATVYLSVKNVGLGVSHETRANLRNLSGDGVLLNKGRFDLSNMKPGETRRLELTFDVLASLNTSDVKLELSMLDRDLHVYATEKIVLPVLPPLAIKAGGSGGVKANATGTLLFPSANPNARAFGKLSDGATLKVLGKADGFYKVALASNQRFAFVKSDQVTETGAPSGSGDPTYEDLLVRSPPIIDLKAALSTTSDKIRVTGKATDSDGILDGYMFVNATKFFYQSNRNATDKKTLPVDLEVPLRPGVNVIRFFARENPDTSSGSVLYIRRDGPKGELLATPKGEQPPFALPPTATGSPKRPKNTAEGMDKK